jgi:HK97 family phage major capsid protein
VRRPSRVPAASSRRRSWAIDQFVGYLRAGRVFADRLNKKVLPAGVSSINLPKVTGGTAVAAQSTQNTAINQQDITTTSVSTPINTLAGGALISMQLIEQSPVSIDDIILQDLANDLAKKIDVAAITAVAAVSG